MLQSRSTRRLSWPLPWIPSDKHPNSLFTVTTKPVQSSSGQCLCPVYHKLSLPTNGCCKSARHARLPACTPHHAVHLELSVFARSEKLAVGCSPSAPVALIRTPQHHPVAAI